MTFQELQNALKIFGFTGRVTLREIKKRHRELVKTCHPDTGEQNDPEQIRLVNAAYGILLEYAEDFRFSFTDEEFLAQNPEERIRLQFADDPLWGSN